MFELCLQAESGTKLYIRIFLGTCARRRRNWRGEATSHASSRGRDRWRFTGMVDTVGHGEYSADFGNCELLMQLLLWLRWGMKFYREGETAVFRGRDWWRFMGMVDTVDTVGNGEYGKHEVLRKVKTYWGSDGTWRYVWNVKQHFPWPVIGRGLRGGWHGMAWGVRYTGIMEIVSGNEMQLPNCGFCRTWPNIANMERRTLRISVKGKRREMMLPIVYCFLYLLKSNS